jgi:4-amino-4-deoxy-L-arabinose transferase-like glycosyltransferase
VNATARAPGWLRGAALAAVLVLGFAGAWNHELRVYDEPREAELARFMWRSGNFAFAVLGGHPFLEKPPLFTATVALAFGALGHASVLAARAVSVLWSFGTLGVVFWLARRVVGNPAAVFSVLVLATMNRFFACQHTILLDNALGAFTTGAIAFGWVAATERRRSFALLAGASLGGAVLTKGLVGAGIAGLVLAIELAWSRDGAGARELLHPGAVALAVAPGALYAAALAHAGGAGFLRELCWDNQVGRFLWGHGSRRSDVLLYARTWWEMVAPWTPLAAAALLCPLVRGGAAPRTWRFLAVWALAPLVALSFSQARARFYAVPVVPAYALLVAWLWFAAGPVPRWLRVLGVAAWLAGALGVAAAVAAIALVDPERLDALAVLAGALALGSLAGLEAARRGACRETIGLSLSLLGVAGFLLSVSGFVAARREPHLSYKAFSDEVWARAGERRLVLFHVQDSYSGTFAFYRDRDTPGFDERRDPEGERLIAAIGSDDLVLAPAGALDRIPPSRRRDLVVEWEGAGVAAEPWPRLTRSPPAPPDTLVLFHKGGSSP